MSRPAFELQSHSTYSDGELSPEGVISHAAAAGVELLALTDHDSLEGVPAAAAAAERFGLRAVSGVEISVIDPIASDLHICGYLVDPAASPLGDQLCRSRADRQQRAERMAVALGELGWELDREMLDTRTASGKTIGRPHLAQAVIEHPANTARLEHEGLADASQFLVAYLIEGRPAFRERLAPTVSAAIDLIHSAGGIAVWAHPFWDVATSRDVLATLDRFVDYGIDGVEAFYPTHTQQQTELLVKRCTELDLTTTGSSDFHGPNHPVFNRFRAFETYGLTPDLGPLA